MTNYLDIIWGLSLKNQSATDYITLCNAAISRESIDGYIEKHHILPKCICDDNTQKLDKNNLVVLTAREHFLAHQLLSQMFDSRTKRKMLYALSGLCFRKNGEQIFNADEYAIIKEASRTAKRGIPLTEEHKQKIKDSFAIFNPNIGRKISDETRFRQSNAKLGNQRSEETKNKISESLKGIPKKPFTNEHKKNISEGQKGRVGSQLGKKQEIVACEYCGKQGGHITMKRYHFDKCKLKVDNGYFDA